MHSSHQRMPDSMSYRWTGLSLSALTRFSFARSVRCLMQSGSVVVQLTVYAPLPLMFVSIFIIPLLKFQFVLHTTQAFALFILSVFILPPECLFFLFIFSELWDQCTTSNSCLVNGYSVAPLTRMGKFDMAAAQSVWWRHVNIPPCCVVGFSWAVGGQ